MDKNDNILVPFSNHMNLLSIMRFNVRILVLMFAFDKIRCILKIAINRISKFYKI